MSDVALVGALCSLLASRSSSSRNLAPSALPACVHPRASPLAPPHPTRTASHAVVGPPRSAYTRSPTSPTLSPSSAPAPGPARPTLRASSSSRAPTAPLETRVATAWTPRRPDLPPTSPSSPSPRSQHRYARRPVLLERHLYYLGVAGKRASHRQEAASPPPGPAERARQGPPSFLLRLVRCSLSQPLSRLLRLSY